MIRSICAREWAGQLILVGLAASPLVMSVRSASADGFGPETHHNGPIELPDDSGASYCFDASYSDTNLRNHAHEAQIYLDNRTATYRIFETCDPSGTDMVFRNLDLPPYFLGLRYCDL